MPSYKVSLYWHDPNEQQNLEHQGHLPITIGRKEGCDVVLQSPRVSRQHARLEMLDENVVLTDLGSANGVLVGGKRIHSDGFKLQDGDRFTIDPFEFSIGIEIVEDEPSEERWFESTMMVSFPTPLNTLSDFDLLMIQNYIKEIHLSAGEYLFRQGDPTDGCYIIDHGLVRIELNREGGNPDDQEDVLTFIEANSMVGEMSLLDRQPRSANAIAHTDLTARHISLETIETLNANHPQIAIKLFMALGNSTAQKLRQTTERLDSLIATKFDPIVEEMIQKADAAQLELLTWDEARLDALLYDIALMGYQHAEELAQIAVEETKLGNVADKTLKNRVASMGVYETLVGQVGYGKMAVHGLVTDIASPVGIVFGLVPITNPTSTFIFKVLVSLKSRNALILSPSRRAQASANRAGELILEVLRRHNAPEALLQWVSARASRKTTITFMAHKKVGLILATGGSMMVKAAYSSGRPAIGVGPGNAPVLICDDADLNLAAQSIVISKSFDYGMICGSEHNLVVTAAQRFAFITALEEQGAAVLNPQEIEAFSEKAVDQNKHVLIEKVVGQSAQKIAELVGIERPYPIRLIVIPSDEISPQNVYAKEKMAPVLGLFTVSDVEQGFDACLDLLGVDGTGHTAVIYSQDESLIEHFGLLMPVSRVLVNSPATHGVVGLSTELPPSLTLGCGTFGGNSTTDNVTFRNLMNVKRLAYYAPERLAALMQS